MTHDILTEPSLSPHARKGREGNREGKGGLASPSIDSHRYAREAATTVQAAPADAATMDGRSAPEHVHRFVPQPEGRLYGKVRYRNRCRCGLRWSPLTREEYLPVGPLCRRCGQPTVATCVDPANPLHPCCAEPRRTR